MVNAMAGLASMTGTLFPKGSDFGDGCSKKDICSKPNEFKAVAMAVEISARIISKDMVDGDASALKEAFGGLCKFCNACRKVFRMPKQT